jgi:hypothetical protein
MDKIMVGLVVLGAVLFSALRAGAGLAAVTGLGYLPTSTVPARLRHFLFGNKRSHPTTLT